MHDGPGLSRKVDPCFFHKTKFLKILTGRFLFITILLLIEIVVVVGGSYLLTTRFLPAFYFYLLCIAGGLVLTVYIINSDINGFVP